MKYNLETDKEQWLLARQTNRYTRYESSSVSVEQAQSLLKSILFTLELVLREEAAGERTVEEIFEEGKRRLSLLVSEGKALLDRQNREEGPFFNNLAYAETIRRGLPMFFAYYDISFAAHEILGTIDYPLSSQGLEWEGAAGVYQYLKSLTAESKVLRYFGPEEIKRLAKAYSPCYREDLYNVFELALTNLLGRGLCGLLTVRLSLDLENVTSLAGRLSALENNRRKECLSEIFSSFLSNMEEISFWDRLYFEKALDEAEGRIRKGNSFGCLERYFYLFD